MLTTARRDVPMRVAVRLEHGESAIATLHGLMESGFVLTERRLFAWRGNGAVGPVPISGIDRILVDAGPGSDHLDVVVLSRRAIHPPLVLTRRGNELLGTLGFVARLARAFGADPIVERLGPVHRFSFPLVAAE